MIDKNKIKSAAQGYCDITYGTLDSHPLIAEAFREGANWAINEFLKNLWHPVWENGMMVDIVLLKIPLWHPHHVMKLKLKKVE